MTSSWLNNEIIWAQIRYDELIIKFNFIPYSTLSNPSLNDWHFAKLGGVLDTGDFKNFNL